MNVIFGNWTDKVISKNELIAGSHLISNRGAYWHHGIYIGGSKIIHYAGLSNKLNKGGIEETTIDAFINGSDLQERRHKKPKYTASQVVERAKNFLTQDSDEYNIVLNNCEHFAHYCVSGVKSSAQVKNIALTSVGAIASIAILYHKKR
jgi:hypothetical protein